MRTDYPAGGDHHNSKLTDIQAQYIRAFRKEGIEVKALADMFNVSVSTIEQIIYKKSYTGK